MADRDGTISHWNSAAAALFGRTELDMLGRSVTDIAPTPESEMLAAGTVAQLVESGRAQVELDVVNARGDDLRIEVRARSLLDDTGIATGFMAVMLDISSRAGAGRRTAETEDPRHRASTQAALLDEVDASVVVTDLDIEVTSWNAGAEQLYGWTQDEAAGRHLLELIAIDRQSGEGSIRALRSGESWEAEQLVRRKDGWTFWAHVRVRGMSDESGNRTGYVGVAIDVSKRREAEHELIKARNHLRAVTDSMAQAVYTADARGCVSYMNPVAQELLGWTMEDLRGHPAHTILHRRRADGSPFPTEECPIMGCIRDGKVAVVADDVFVRRDGTELPVAYTAAPLATEDGIEGYVIVFEDITVRKAETRRVGRKLEKLSWMGRVNEALAEDRFELHAQPIIDVGTGRVVQRELLLRMRGPDAGGLVGPASFLPVAEEYGLIGDIDRWVIDRSAEIAATGLAVELNVSARSICDPRLVDHIGQAIARTGASPQKMVFEITETALAGDERAARLFVERLHHLGFKLALDDFGTGYGGFTYLKTLPIDYLKIDTEFVRDLPTNPSSRKVVEAIVKLAQGFGLRTVAEGVEDTETLRLLEQLTVDYAQGFHIGRPALLDP